MQPRACRCPSWAGPGRQQAGKRGRYLCLTPLFFSRIGTKTGKTEIRTAVVFPPESCLCLLPFFLSHLTDLVSSSPLGGAVTSKHWNQGPSGCPPASRPGLLIKHPRVWVILISHGLLTSLITVSLYPDHHRLLPPNLTTTSPTAGSLHSTGFPCSGPSQG